MQHLNDSEMRRLLEVAYSHNANHHLLLLTAWNHGLRVSEAIGIRGTDISSSGKLTVKRLKRSKKTVQCVRMDEDALFDQSPILELARKGGSNLLFPYCRSTVNKFMLRYGLEAGLDKSQLHPHAIKHSTAMRLWNLTKHPGDLTAYLGHRAASSSLIYLEKANDMDAQQAFAQAVTA